MLRSRRLDLPSHSYYSPLTPTPTPAGSPRSPEPPRAGPQALQVRAAGSVGGGAGAGGAGGEGGKRRGRALPGAADAARRPSLVPAWSRLGPSLVPAWSQPPGAGGGPAGGPRAQPVRPRPFIPICRGRPGRANKSQHKRPIVSEALPSRSAPLRRPSAQCLGEEREGV